MSSLREISATGLGSLSWGRPSGRRRAMIAAVTSADVQDPVSEATLRVSSKKFSAVLATGLEGRKLTTSLGCYALLSQFSRR